MSRRDIWEEGWGTRDCMSTRTTKKRPLEVPVPVTTEEMTTQSSFPFRKGLKDVVSSLFRHEVSSEITSKLLLPSLYVVTLVKCQQPIRVRTEDRGRERGRVYLWKRGLWEVGNVSRVTVFTRSLEGRNLETGVSLPFTRESFQKIF